MKVYIVTMNAYEGEFVEGVFSSREKALRWVLNEKGIDLTTPPPNDIDGQHDYLIDEWEVD
jgi:hypothetical protein